MQNQVNQNQVSYQQPNAFPVNQDVISGSLAEPVNNCIQVPIQPKSLVDIYNECTEEFTDEGAIKADTSRGFALTSIQPQFIRERLNQVFGMFGWKLTGDFKEVGGGIMFEGNLTVTVGEVSHSHMTVGFAKIGKNLGDNFKAAYTDALSKGASNYGIGNSVFKGLVAPPEGGSGGGKPGGFKKTTTRKKSVTKPATQPVQTQTQQAQPGANPFIPNQAPQQAHPAPQQATKQADQLTQQPLVNPGQGVMSPPVSGNFVM